MRSHILADARASRPAGASTRFLPGPLIRPFVDQDNRSWFWSASLAGLPSGSPASSAFLASGRAARPCGWPANSSAKLVRWLGADAESRTSSRITTRDPHAQVRGVRPCGQKNGGARRRSRPAHRGPRGSRWGPLQLPGEVHRRHLGRCRRCVWCTAMRNPKTPHPSWCRAVPCGMASAVALQSITEVTVARSRRAGTFIQASERPFPVLPTAMTVARLRRQTP